MTVLSAQNILRKRPILNMVGREEVAYGRQKFTHGLSPAGYDLRLDEVKRFKKADGVWLLPPGSFVLASAMEEFSMPDDLIGIVHDKSSWARRGLAVQNTVIEPGWRGFLTLELTNHSKVPLQLVRGMGICQVLFHQLDEPTDLSYRGKYQDQKQGPQEAM